MYKELLAAAAIFLTVAMYVPYVRSIRAGRTKPHVFSWITWTLGAFVVFVAQLAGHGGAGAWPIGVSGLVTAYIAVLAYRHRTDTSTTRTIGYSLRSLSQHCRVGCSRPIRWWLLRCLLESSLPDSDRHSALLLVIHTRSVSDSISWAPCATHWPFLR
jgi:hypothetical protein